MFWNSDNWHRDTTYDEDTEYDEDGDVDELPDMPIGDGTVVCNGKVDLKFKLNLDETFDENVDRLEVYEDELNRKIEDFWIATLEEDYSTLPLYMEMSKRLKRVGSNDYDPDNYGMCFGFSILRGLEETYGFRSQKAV